MDTEGFFILALAAFRKAHNLPEGGDAEDLLSYRPMTQEQYDWLVLFCAMWDRFVSVS